MLEFIEEENKLNCMFSGQLDTQNCMDMENHLKNAIKDEIAVVVFNLQGVEYVCSLFLGICVQTSKLAPGKEFVIINVQPSVKKLFKISGLDKVINVK